MRRRMAARRHVVSPPHLAYRHAEAESWPSSMRRQSASTGPAMPKKLLRRVSRHLCVNSSAMRRGASICWLHGFYSALALASWLYCVRRPPALFLAYASRHLSSAAAPHHLLPRPAANWRRRGISGQRPASCNLEPLDIQRHRRIMLMRRRLSHHVEVIMRGDSSSRFSWRLRLCF